MVHYLMYKKIALSLCFTLFLGLLSACSPKGILHLKKAESQNQKTAQNSQNIKNSTEISTPIALPPSFNSQPLKPGQTNTVYMPNGLPALKPMKGINADTLFLENIKNTGDRFNRVENAVVDLRKEFDTYKPSIVRLAAVESDIQNLIKELEVLLQETPAEQLPLNLIENSEVELQVSQLNTQQELQPPDDQKDNQAKTKVTEKLPPKVTSPSKPIKKKVKSKFSIKKYDGIVAKNLRAGEHVDKLRIVIDTNKNTDFSIDLDNNEKLIIIELPNARWVGKNSINFKHSKLIESFNVEKINKGNGTMIILSLRKETSIISQNRLNPEESSLDYKIYFDLKL